MASFIPNGARALLTTALLLVPGVVWAQQPSPGDQSPPPAQDPATPKPDDDGPKPAGVGSSQPPKPEEPTDSDLPQPLPATSFPGVPLSGTAPSARPYSGLFGGAEPAARRKHSLSLSGSLFAAYSTNIAAQSVDGQVDPRAGQASTLAGGSGSLNYNRDWTSGVLGAYLSGSRSWIQQYQDTQDPWLSRWNTGVNGAFGKQLSRRTRLGAHAAASYSPYLSFGVPDFSNGGIGSLPILAPGLDYALAHDPSVLTSAGTTLSYALNRKSSLETYYEVVAQTFVSASPDNSDRLEQMIGGRYRYQFSRFAGLRAGYGYRRASVGGPDSSPISSHYIDVGLDAGYGRSYALTRRTTFSFSTNSNLFVNETAAAGADNSFDPQTRMFVGGSADLTHTMGRTWAATTSYRRTVSYVVGFDEPVLSDSAIGSLGGLITERLDFSAVASYTSGRVGFSGPGNGFGTSSATASLRYAISRHLATYAQYFYYHYSFERNVTLPSYLQPQLDRQGASVGITAWLPLIGSRGRR
jgi:hypothetical protein